jgi:UDP-N-acetylmuramoylalanine--D-glutamate ligase
MNILILGLGSHGGGAESAAYFASHAHHVTVTDIKGEHELASSLEDLKKFSNITYSLGSHNLEDFQSADIIIKNPGVPDSLEILRDYSEIITNDIGYFLKSTTDSCWAVTGSKGKSTTVDLLTHILTETGEERVFKAGNIGINPLSFIDELTGHDCIILELSSWQIHDLSRHPFRAFERVVFTPLYADHQDQYPSMHWYVEDKLRILNSPPKQIILPARGGYESYVHRFEDTSVLWYDYEGPLQPGRYGLSRTADGYQFTDQSGYTDGLVSHTFDLRHIPAVTAACAEHISLETCVKAVNAYTPLSCRFEHIGTFAGLTYINDSAATIPEALKLSLDSCSGAVHLIAGGTDKRIDPRSLKAAADSAASLHLLSGSLTDRLLPILERPYYGPFETMDEAVDSAIKSARPGDTVLLSPGAASFGLFAHEFDRGEQFREAVYRRLR